MRPSFEEAILANQRCQLFDAGLWDVGLAIEPGHAEWRSSVCEPGI